MGVRDEASVETVPESAWSCVAQAVPRPLDAADGRRQRDELRARLFDVPRVPEHIGRYEIVRRLGQGALGTVYLARDAHLARRIAVKVLRGGNASHGALRLQREARAMAQLSHPNVAKVFEVGVHHGDVFVAMEFVDGETLRQWQQGRTHAEILGAYLQAGRGLAAAHHARIVHRDFKPDNAMIGRDGRVRVLDFGVARAFDPGSVLATTARSAEDASGFAAAACSVDDVVLTQTGSTLGTPAYMPPEQIGNGNVDARADQFAFAVALFEALTGTRPFSGRTIAELVAAVTAGVDAAAASRLAPDLRRILMRALQLDPSSRYDDMDRLCADLQRVRRRRPWRRGLALVGAASLMVALALGGGHDRCVDRVDSFHERWSAEASAALRRRGTDDVRWQGAVEAVDHGVEAWRLESAALCAGTEDELDAPVRWACLDDVRRSIEAAIDGLHMAADHDAAAGAVPRILDRDACVRVRKRGAVPLAPHVGGADAVARVRAGMASAITAGRAADYDEAAELIAPAVDEARVIDQPVLLSEALLLQSATAVALDRHEEAERAAIEAYELAQAVGHDRLALRAAADLVAQVGHRQGRRADGEGWARAGAALAERFDPTDYHRTRFLLNRGLMRLEFGETDAAREDLEAARAGYIAAFGPDTPELVPVLGNLAHIAFEARDFAQAEALLGEQLALIEREFGGAHRDVIRVLSNRSLIAIEREEWDEARADLARAVALCEGRQDALDCVGVEGQRAQLDGATGAFASARSHAQAHLDGLLAVLGPANPRVVRARVNLAVTMGLTGAAAEARVLLHRAIVEAEAQLEDEGAPLTEALLELAHTELRLGEVELAARALARGEPGAARDRCLSAQWHARHARVMVDRDDAAAALAALRMARTHAEGCSSLVLAELDLAQATAQLAVGGGDAEVERCVEAALAGWRGRGGDWNRIATAVARWFVTARRTGAHDAREAPIP